MGVIMDRVIKNKWDDFKKNLINSKKYWFFYSIIVFLSSMSIVNINNFFYPKLEILVFLLVLFVGIVCISYYFSHRDDKELYKTAFIVILIFGILFSVFTPICCNPDEVEHFVRAEITSNGVLIPEYDRTPYIYENKYNESGSYLTIQSVLDLIEEGKSTRGGGYDAMDFVNSSILNTNADTEPINHTVVKYHSAFAQNPFFGYLFSALGIFLAKLLDLNAIWMLWLGRIFNALLYASLIALAIKKTPILKMPLFVFSNIPFVLRLAGSVSIDPVINGLAILAIAYFLYLYKSPKKELTSKHIIKFSLIILLLGLCKVTYFVFIFLILFIPKSNFKDKKCFLYGLISIVVLLIVFVLWSKFYVDPGVFASCRSVHYDNSANAIEQLKFILSHKKDTLIELCHIFANINNDLSFTDSFNSLFLMYLGGICLLYPKPKIELKPRIGALLVLLMLYFGTYIVFMLSWTPVGQLTPIGVQPRYFFPAFALIPFIFGINNDTIINKDTIDIYTMVISISFVAMLLMSIILTAY